LKEIKPFETSGFPDTKTEGLRVSFSGKYPSTEVIGNEPVQIEIGIFLCFFQFLSESIQVVFPDQMFLCLPKGSLVKQFRFALRVRW
jgi:hypothetical protein